MSDGLNLTVQQEHEMEATLDLSNYASWIELQPITTLAGMLDVTANELYRRGRYREGNELKYIVTELRA